MQRLTITVPRILDLHSSLEFSRVLAEVELQSAVQLDFARCDRVEPFGLLLISSEIALLRKRIGSSIECVNTNHMVEAAQMGFFYALGVEHGVQLVQANSQVIPVTIFDCETMIRNAALKGVETGDEVETQSRKMSEMLCRTDEGDVYDTLAYAIREIMRNVLEHSSAMRFGICAKFYENLSRVEVAILDRGVGLKCSLSKNPHLDASDDRRAINYALMPAVSGKAFKGSRVKQSGPWANSGFGLYMTNRICRNGGNFFVATGQSGMLLTKGQGKRYFDCDFSGTAIRMIIRTDSLSSLRNALAQYRQDGYSIQSKYREIVRIDPSSASLMLSADFDLSTWDRLLARLKGK